MTDTDAIIRFVLGELDPAQAAALQARLASDPHGAALLASIQATATTLDRAAAEDADFAVPPAALAGLYALAPTAAPSLAARAAAAVDRVLAALTLDSWAGLAVAGIRGGDGSRRLVFESPAASVDLRIEPSLTRLNAFDCVGRITAESPCVVTWHEVDRGAAHTSPTDADGFFECTVSAGTHRLEVSLGGRVIMTPTINHPLGDGRT